MQARLRTLILAVLLSVAPVKAEDGASAKLTFASDILPIFKTKCIRCHAGVEPKAGLNLTSPSSLLSGGESGSALRIRAAEFSLLYEKISSDQMPPVGQKLTAEEKGLVRRWINDGAEGVSNAAVVDRSDDITGVEHWAFQPPVRPPVPQLADVRIRNPIDAFVLRRLGRNGLAMAPEADAHTLIRRACIDLTGLPPAPADVRAFVSSQEPQKYEKLIDRLLAQSQYGERWARHWLDVAGYADTAGILSEDRELPLTWRYRDYVIASFNSDKPYDRFLQEQIAGDELTDYWSAYETHDRLPAEVVDGILGTGFLRMAADPSRPDFKTIKNAEAQYYYPTLFDTLQIVSSATMGLTVQCARCHSHKFDPIPQVDYYRMQSVFMAAYRPEKWLPQMERRLLIASKKERDAAEIKNAEVDANLKQINAELTQLKTSSTQQVFDLRLSQLPMEIRDDVRQAVTTSAKSRSEVQKYLAGKFEATLRPQGKDLDEALLEIAEYKSRSDELRGKLAAEEKRRWLFDEVRALYDLPGPVETPVLLRGDPLTPGPPVQPGALSALQTPEPFRWVDPGPDAKTSGRRLAFARWLTQPGHPLTARVMVNRIWMHHFGVGLVSTPDDFGISGATPSHPELLDWLATEFVQSGWSVKHMHRLIMTSSTWRQHSLVSPAARESGVKADPENRLLWRFRTRRMDAEALRDSLLEVAGTLNRTPFKSSMAVARQANGEARVPDSEDQNLRSIYLKVKRLTPESMLEAFDRPNISVNCVQRSVSTVSTQALTLLNSDMMVRLADSFADRVVKAGAEWPAGDAVLIAYSRPATARELQLLGAFLEEQTGRYLASSGKEETKMSQAEAEKRALADLCHMLMSSNEFAYLD